MCHPLLKKASALAKVEDLIGVVAASVQRMCDVAASMQGMVGEATLVQGIDSCLVLRMNRSYKNSMNHFSLFSSAFVDLRNSFILSSSCTLSCSGLFSFKPLNASIIALFAFSALLSFVGFLYLGRHGCTVAVAEEGPEAFSAAGPGCR